MNANVPVFSPAPGDIVEVYDSARREYRRARVVSVPMPTSPRYVVETAAPRHKLEASIFDLRQWEPPIADAVPNEFEIDENTPVVAVPHEHVLEAFPVSARNAAREDTCGKLLADLVDVYDPETPGRMARAFGDLTSGYGANLKAILKTFPVEGDQGIVLVRDVPFASLCEHHVLPFTGTASIVYIPDGTIVGLSKIPRLVRALSRRLQVQERLGSEIGTAMWEHLKPKGVMVVLRGRHSCMAIRGVESPGEMVTSFVLGAFREDPMARAEAMQLMR